MNRFGNHSERRQTARKEHVCWGGSLAKPCIIRPGDVYIVGVTLPGSGHHPIGGGDYEVEDWPFGWIKVCFDHYYAEYNDVTPADLEAIRREEMETTT